MESKLEIAGMFAIWCRSVNLDDSQMGKLAADKLKDAGIEVTDRSGVYRCGKISNKAIDCFTGLLTARENDQSRLQRQLHSELRRCGIGVEFKADGSPDVPPEFAHLGDGLSRFAAGIKFRGNRKD